MIQLNLIGHLGQDCSVNVVNGKSVINFSVAHSEVWADASGEKKEKTTWVSCSYWTDRTKIADYLKKGTQIFCTGTPSSKLFDTSNGTTLSQIALRVKEIQLLSSGGGNKQETSTQQSSDNLADDLPF